MGKVKQNDNFWIRKTFEIEILSQNDVHNSFKSTKFTQNWDNNPLFTNFTFNKAKIQFFFVSDTTWNKK